MRPLLEDATRLFNGMSSESLSSGLTLPLVPTAGVEGVVTCLRAPSAADAGVRRCFGGEDVSARG